MSTDDNPIVALFDMDGTLADHNGELLRRLHLMRSPDEPATDLSASSRDSQPEYLRERIRVIRSNPGFWLNLPVLAAGFEVLEEAHRLGFQIKGPRHSPIDWMEKLQWCDKHLTGYPHQVTISMDTVIMPDQPWNQGFEHLQVYRYAGDRREMVGVLERVITTANTGSQR